LTQRDEQRFRELYDRTYDRICAFVMRRADGDVVPDVVSDTYLAVWRRINDVPAGPRMADAWVFKTAYQVLTNTHRGNRRRTALFARIRQRPVDLIVEFSTNSDADARVTRALEQVRPEQREILALKFWDDLDVDQIARILGCTRNAAAVRLTRAQQAFGTAFEALPAERADDSDEGGER
jgi:RNA polymerase sigma-70 factor (ECF subfamily)